MNTTLRALLSAALVVGLFGVAVAKLPPPTEEQKAAAAAKKEKDAAGAAKAKDELKQAEDRVVSRYVSEQKAKGVTVTPQAGPDATPSTASNAGAKRSPASNTAKK